MALPTLHLARALATEVVRHVRRHDLVFYAAGLTFYAATAVVPLLLVAWFAAALVPATGYGGQGAAGAAAGPGVVAGGLKDLAAALG